MDISQIRKVKATMNRISELEGQDKGLVIEMTEAMLTDLEVDGELQPLTRYIERYCYVLDDPVIDAGDLAIEIETMLAAAE